MDRPRPGITTSSAEQWRHGATRYRRSRGPNRPALLIASLLAMVVVGLGGWEMASRAEAIEVGANVELEQWETRPAGGWIKGNLGNSNSDYHEGETIPFQVTINDDPAGQYTLTICRDFIDAGGHYGYLFLAPYDTSRAAVPSGGSPTTTDGAIAGVNLTSIDSVTPGTASADCNSSDQRSTVVVFTKPAGVSWLLFGGRLAAAGDLIPGGGTVAAGSTAGHWSGASLHMHVSPNKDVSINTGQGIFPPPSLTKAAGGYDVATGTATWSVSIENPNPFAEKVAITDPGVTVVGGNPSGCSGSLATSMLCTVGSESTLSFQVSKSVARQCQPGTAVNSATAVLSESGLPLAGSPTGDVPVNVPGEPTLCDLPIFSKTASGYDPATDTATWIIAVTNAGPNTTARQVTITDPGVVVVGGPPTGCSGDIGTGMDCTVAAGATLTFSVSKVVAQQCAPGEATNSAEAVLVGTSQHLSGSPTGPIAVAVPGDPGLCSVPTLSKTAVGYNTTTDTATWTITIDNTGGNVTDRQVTITDSGVTVVGGTPGACSGAIATGLTCTVAAGTALAIDVSAVVGQACQPGTATNSAVAVLTGTGAALPGSPTANIEITVPADEALCSLPALTKTAVGFDSASDTATWLVVVDNSGPNAIGRDVVITDAGVTVVGGNPAGCTGSITTGMTCPVAARTTLSFQVSKVVAQQCQPGTAANTASATLAGTATSLAGSPTPSITVVVPADEGLCGVPTLAKSAAGYDTASDTASWTVVITNTGPNAIARSVTITDTGVTVVGGNPTGCTGDITAGMTCSVAAGATVSFQVSKVVAQQCQPGTASNTASAVLANTSTPLTGSPTGSVSISVPSDTALCSVPTLTKGAVGFNSTTDTATWTVTIANTGANAIARTVTITDAGVTVVGGNPAGCTGTITSGMTCSVAAGTTLSFQVSKVVAQQCQPGTATNTASAVLANTSTPLTGSPTASVSIAVPSDTALCSLPTLTKSAVGFNTATDTATWTVTIANTGGNAIARTVTITDAAVTVVGGNPAGCTGTITSGMTCSVAAGTTLSFQVAQVVGQQCQPGTATNTASAVLANTSTPLTGSPTATVSIAVPADSALCSLPTLTKSIVGYNTTTETATWTVSVGNTGANAIARTVTITDAGVTVVGGNPSGCTGAIASGMTCTVGPGATLSFQVSRVVAQQCQPGIAANVASAVVTGSSTPLGGSPTGSAAIAVPADLRLCTTPTSTPPASTPTATATAPATLVPTSTPTPTSTAVPTVVAPATSVPTAIGGVVEPPKAGEGMRPQGGPDMRWLLVVAAVVLIVSAALSAGNAIAAARRR